MSWINNIYYNGDSIQNYDKKLTFCRHGTRFVSMRSAVTFEHALTSVRVGFRCSSRLEPLLLPGTGFNRTKIVRSTAVIGHCLKTIA